MPLTTELTAAMSEAERHALYRRSLMVVVVSQLFGGAGLATAVSIAMVSTTGGVVARPLSVDLLGGVATRRTDVAARVARRRALR